MSPHATDGQILSILANPFYAGRKWSIQGLGMLRTYLDPEGIERLHIWLPETAVENVSTIHDHPWDFDSRIISGRMVNQRYVEVQLPAHEHPVRYLRKQQIVCGVGGHLVGEPTPTQVVVQPCEDLAAGAEYHQDAEELHDTFPEAGCVSVIRRTFHANLDIATVMWQHGDWVSAEPREATDAEVLHFTTVALKVWAPA